MRDAAQHVAAQELAVDVDELRVRADRAGAGHAVRLQESPVQGSLKTYSGTGSRAQPRKGPAHGAGNDVRKLRLRANGGSIERHIRAQQESYEGLSANTNDGTTHLFGSLGRPGIRPDVKERNFLPRFAGGCIVRPIFPTRAQSVFWFLLHST